MPTAPYTLEQSEEDAAALRGQVDGLSEYAEIGTLVVSGVVVAQQPATSTSPETQETWHSFAPLSNSWSVPGSGYASYRITPQNELQISAWILGPATSVNSVTIATFPVGYRPASKQGFPVGADVVQNNANGSSPRMEVATTGILQAFGLGASPNVYFNVKIPLDV